MRDLLTIDFPETFSFIMSIINSRTYCLGMAEGEMAEKFIKTLTLSDERPTYQ